MHEAKLVSGPFEGAKLGRAARPVFVWVGVRGGKHVAYREPGKRRLLYRCIGREREVEIYEFAGYLYKACKCGGVTELAAAGSPPTCQGCGEPLRVRARA